MFGDRAFLAAKELADMPLLEGWRVRRNSPNTVQSEENEMQKQFKAGLASALFAVIMAGAGISTASAETTSAPYRPQGRASANANSHANSAQANSNNPDNCGYSDPMDNYRSPTPRYERERFAPPVYPEYRPRRPYRHRARRGYRRGGSWRGMPWDGGGRGSSWSFGSDDMPWGNRRGRHGRGFSFGSDDFGFGSDDFKPWGRNRHRGHRRGFNFGSDDFKPW